MLCFVILFHFCDEVLKQIPLRNGNSSSEKLINIGNVFTLETNESRVLEILHTPNCIVSSMHVALNVEYCGKNTRVDSNFNNINSIILLLEYYFIAREIKECIPTLTLL